MRLGEPADGFFDDRDLGRPDGAGPIWFQIDLAVDRLADLVSWGNLLDRLSFGLAGRPASAYFIEHYLAIAEVYAALQVAVRAAGLSLVWLNEVEAAHRYTLPSGEERRLEPDGVFLLGGSGFVPTAVFLEVDRSTESAQQWQHKVRDYSAYFLAREGFLAQWSTWPPRVEFLRHYTAEEWAVAWRGHKLPIGFAVHDGVCAGGILEQPWTGLDRKPFRILAG